MVCLVAACASVVSQAEEPVILETDSFSAVQAESLRLGKKYGNDKVLLVFDIDNTLLAMRQDLGSDPWFTWQDNLPENHPWRVGNFKELLRAQGVLFAISSMRVTDPAHQPGTVQQLRKAGFTTLLLTSRGFRFRDATRRELQANGYDFSESTLTLCAGFPGPYLPYEPGQIEQSGISRQEARMWLPKKGSDPVEIRKSNPVSYSEGVYMTAGQHKGAMLRMLLHKSGNVGRFRAIVFVDDHAKHTEAMSRAFEDQGLKLVCFRYSREDANVRRFNENQGSAKLRATRAWFRLKHSLNRHTLSN